MDLKSAIFRYLNESMKVIEYKSPRSFFDFDPDSHIIAISNVSSEAPGPIITKFYVEPSGAERTKACSNGPGHMTNMMAMPVDRKTFRNFLV